MTMLPKCQLKCHLGKVQHIPKIALHRGHLGLSENRFAIAADTGTGDGS